MLFRDGMFMDGVIYSSISHNLANGYGSFWSPMYTETVDVYFNSHPPLVFWIQSIFFNVFGEGFWIERLYMLVILILSLVGLYKILTAVNRKELFIYTVPLLLFTPLLLWGHQNNMLECTLMLFTLWSIYVALLIIKEKIQAVIGLIIMALLIFMGFLSKGLPGLFPIGVFVLYSISHSKYTYKKAVTHSVILIGAISLFGFVLLLNKEAFAFFEGYFDNQIIRSLNGDLDEVFPGRITVLLGFIMELGILFGVSLISILWKKVKNKPLFTNESNKQMALFFFLVGVSASFPLIVSPKLRTFYFIPAIPYFILCTTLLIPALSIKQRTLSWIKYLGISLSVVGIAFTIVYWAHPKRDSALLSDIHNIAAITSDKTIVLCDNPTRFNHTIRAYFMRYHFISLSLENELIKTDEKIKYYIRKGNFPTYRYSLVDTGSKELFLFELDTDK